MKALEDKDKSLHRDKGRKRGRERNRGRENKRCISVEFMSPGLMN